MSRAKGKKAAVKLTAALVYEALQRRYTSDAGWAILPQVRNQVGFSHGAIRTADALAMQLYPSRGLSLVGFEIKVNRGDWLKELREADKAEAIAQYCHQWVIAAPKGLIALEELPEGWGLIEVDEQLRTRMVKEAPAREPEPVAWPFLAAIFRNLGRRELDDDASEVIRKKAFAEGRAAALKDMQWELEELEKLKQHAAILQAATGIGLGRWTSDKDLQAVGKAVKRLLMYHNNPFDQIQAQVRDLEACMRGVLEKPMRDLETLRNAAKAFDHVTAEYHQVVENAVQELSTKGK